MNADFLDFGYPNNGHSPFRSWHLASYGCESHRFGSCGATGPRKRGPSCGIPRRRVAFPGERKRAKDTDGRTDRRIPCFEAEEMHLGIHLVRRGLLSAADFVDLIERQLLTRPPLGE